MTTTLPEATEITVDDGEWQTLTSNLFPLPGWSFTDAAGHEHHYLDPEYDKRDVSDSVLVESEPYYCAECQDEHTTTTLHCSLCGERLYSATTFGTRRIQVSGPTFTATVPLDLSSGKVNGVAVKGLTVTKVNGNITYTMQSGALQGATLEFGTPNGVLSGRIVDTQYSSDRGFVVVVRGNVPKGWQ